MVRLFQDPSCCQRYLVVVAWLIGIAFSLPQRFAEAQSGSGSVPDLLRLYPLMERLEQEQTAWTDFASSIPRFLSPSADEVDQLLEVDATVRTEALDWLERFTPSQILVERQDIEGLRQRIAQLPPAALNRWLDQTVELRNRLTGEDWSETNRWLREFLQAQAIYSPGDLARFRQLLAKADLSQWWSVLDHFEAIRRERQVQSTTSWQYRQQRLATADQMRSSPRISSAGMLAGRRADQQLSPVSRNVRRSPLIFRSPSLSQRVSNVFVLRSIYGNNWPLWGIW